MAELDPDQKDLFITICEAARRQQRGEKESFIAVRTGRPTIQHSCLTTEVTKFHWPDLDILRRYRLIAGKFDRHTAIFDVTPSGFDYYATLMNATAIPAGRVEDAVRRFLDSSSFVAQFHEAHRRWAEAEALLWTDHDGSKATAIGHHCREAMQAFGSAFAHATGETAGKPTDTVKNIKVGLQALRGRVPDGRLALLEGLLPYWGAVVDFVQRQEHGASKEGEPITVDDSRLAVFHTAIVMFELASALTSAAPSR